MNPQTLPCTPPPPELPRVGSFFFVSVSSLPKKNVLGRKPVLFGVIQVKRPQNVVFTILTQTKVKKLKVKNTKICQKLF